MAGLSRSNKSKNDRTQMLGALIFLIVITIFMWVVYFYSLSDGSSPPPFGALVLTACLIYASVRYKRAKK